MSDRTPRTFPGVGGTRVRAEEALAHRVEGTGPDVAEDHAKGGQGEWSHRRCAAR